MLQTKIAEHIDFRVDTEKLASQLRNLIEAQTKQFDFLLHCYRCYYVGAVFLVIACMALFLAAVFGAIPTYIAALSLGALALAGCATFVGHRYLSLYKPERWAALVTEFGETCRCAIPYHEEISDHHLFLASAYTLFAERIKGRASTYLQGSYIPSCFVTSLAYLSELCYNHDNCILREMLLKAALAEQLDLVKRNPLNLTHHSQLANTYVLLSRLFLDTSVPSANAERFRYYAAGAVAEFQIIATYAPDDPWVQTQLAMSYRDLHMPREEIQACETILKLCPTDSDTLLRLGTLYFQLGNNAKGLRIYEELRCINWKLAEQLIVYYGDVQNH